jgi:hypothetical protein
MFLRTLVRHSPRKMHAVRLFLQIPPALWSRLPGSPAGSLRHHSLSPVQVADFCLIPMGIGEVGVTKVRLPLERGASEVEADTFFSDLPSPRLLPSPCWVQSILPNVSECWKGGTAGFEMPSEAAPD